MGERGGGRGRRLKERRWEGRRWEGEEVGGGGGGRRRGDGRGLVGKDKMMACMG